MRNVDAMYEWGILRDNADWIADAAARGHAAAKVEGDKRRALAQAQAGRLMAERTAETRQFAENVFTVLRSGSI
ncbi:MAG: hypothetical protein WEA77_09230 [Hyphomonas sp.]|uniref:hypothetical protein n=1 Tax=Hyphomonas sp. TaxID=87 RepID=UPI00349FE19B